ncbi:MAG: TolC family protein [Candidatus Krumholzibacteria bacterium]|nr:TolC family protein [Candidatus Krumholzibacteria bacterium]
MNLKVSILVIACLVLAPLAASGTEIRVGIEDIPGMALAGSPFALILDGDLSLAQAERDLAVRWTNPSLVWEMEEVGNDDVTSREWVVALEKEFAMPWSYAKKRSGSNLRLESARRSWEASRWHLISHMRHGYVTLKLRDIEEEILEVFEEIIGDASRVITDRKEQGTVSGIEKRLIDMSLITVRARMVETRLERREVMDEWKTAMGIPAEDTVILVSEVDLSADWLSSSHVTADGSSDVESRRLAMEALGKDIGLEKGDIFPSLSIAGGYKNVDDEFTGFIFGLSIPIPVLNRNSGGIDRATAEHRKAQVELDLYETARERHLSRLMLAARDEADLLKKYHGDFEFIEEHVADLALSYREGWIDLGDFLEGIRTYAEGIESYFDMLEDYNDIVFELERLTEQELYAPGTARKEETGS